MLSKTRTTIIALVASASFAVASAAPAVSQAQWHNYCVAGHCITHTNFTSGDPCGSYNKAYEGLLEALQRQKELASVVNPQLTQGEGGAAEAQKQVEEAEAQVHLASVAAFEWGCDVAVRTSRTSVVVAPGGAVQAPLEGSSSPVRLMAPSSSLSMR